MGFCAFLRQTDECLFNKALHIIGGRHSVTKKREEALIWKRSRDVSVSVTRGCAVPCTVLPGSQIALPPLSSVQEKLPVHLQRRCLEENS